MRKSEATLGAGCFWCIEACLKELTGVLDVEPGYSGGHIKNPAYREVCQGRTGHAEVARVIFDEDVLTFEKLLEAFFFVHDPTQLNRQGNDVGTQYRSAIFFHTDEHQRIANKIIDELDASGSWPKPIVTEVSPLTNYYPAEDYHKNYLENNPENPYCQMVVRPKYEKFKSAFVEVLKN